MQHYIYDASGERILKASSTATQVYVNGTLQNNNITMNNYTSYPSGFLVVDPNGYYTKHYYMGAQRFACRLGEDNASIFEGKSADMSKLKELQQKDLLWYANRAGHKTVDYAPYTVQTIEDLTDDKDGEDPGTGGGAEVPPAIYYYHPDHLGTNTFITELNGYTYQVFLNLPFGETMAEQITSSGYYQNHYKFNGKELDNETGMYYYGARYYEPRLSVWMSVDPIAEKYPNMSPFVYCANNPMMFVDPDGNTFRIWYVDVNNKNQSFVFNGTNASSAPQNTYVQNFIKAYNYDVGNGGGTSLKTIATSTKNEVSIAEAHGTSASYGGSAIFWNPNGAELTTDNKVLSPSTVLEEEATHYLHWIRNAKELYELRKKPVPKFDNAEEERTKLNEVAKTARANKEVPSKWVPKDHHSSAIGVDDPTSNKPTKESNTKFFNKLEKNTPYDWTEEKKKADTYLKNQ